MGRMLSSEVWICDTCQLVLSSNLYPPCLGANLDGRSSAMGLVISSAADVYSANPDPHLMPYENTLHGFSRGRD